MFVLGRKRILVPFTRSPRVQFVRLRSGLAISTQLVRMSAVNKIHQLRCDWKPKRSRTTWIELSVTKELPRSKNASCRSRTMWRVGERLRTTVMSGSWTKFQAIRCPSKLRAALIVATYLRPLLQFFAIIVGGGLFDLRLDLVNTRFDVGFLAGAVDDRRVLLVDHHLLGTAEHVDRDVLELDAEVFTDRLATRQDGDVLQHGLAAIAEARRLHRRDLQAAAQLVDDERGKRLAFDVLGHDEQRLAGLYDRFKQRQQLLQGRKLLLVNEDVRVLHLRPHLVRVGDEVGRDIATVELHAFDHVELGLQRLRLFNRDHAFVADLLHGLGKEVADLGIAVGGDSADLRDLLVRGDFLRIGLQMLDHGIDGEIDTALEIRRVHARRNRLGAFLDDRLRENRSSGGAIAGNIRGLGSDLAHHLRAHVFEFVFQLNFFGDRHTVLGDARSTE